MIIFYLFFNNLVKKLNLIRIKSWFKSVSSTTTLTAALSATTASNATAPSSISASTPHDTTATTSGATPTLNPISNKSNSKKLLNQLQIVNKQLKLLRDNPSNNASNIPLETATNLINTVTTVMPTASNNASTTAGAFK